MEYETLKLTQEWDKTFPKSDKVDHRKVTFHNRFGITLAADLYQPKGGPGKAGRHRGVRSLRRGEGAGLRPVCPDPGGAGLSDYGL